MFNLNISNLLPYIEVFPIIFISFVIGFLITPILRLIGLRFGFSTKPKSLSNENERGYETRLHKVTMSRLGEFAVLIPLFILIWNQYPQMDLKMLGILVSIAIIGILGAFDSKYNLSEIIKLPILIIATLILIFTGTYFDITSSLFNPGIPDIYFKNPITNSDISSLSFLFTLIWIPVISTAVSYVGGVDGLSEGTTAIALMIFLLIGIRINDPITVSIASICLGGLVGLLPYNFHPAIIYSEHLIYGFLIAILSITSQAKIATSILILTLPIVDFVYVVINRTNKFLQSEKEKNFLNWLRAIGTGDKNHLHHKMLQLGLKPHQISLIQYLIYAILGLTAIAVSGMFLTLSLLGTLTACVLIYYWINIKIINNKNE
ncbi:MAG: hypothetical protein N3A71_02615 [Candidatus Dojkabacteria bacterium]|nr:hypothetical protein [Candidatus Dojkabacteria bacterium]